MLSRDDELAKQQAILSSIATDTPSISPTLVSSSRPGFESDDLLFDMTDDFDTSFPSPSLATGSRGRRGGSSVSSSPMLSRRASKSSWSLDSTPTLSPHYTSLHASPAGSTKIQVSPRPRPEPIEAGSSSTGISVSPLNIGHSDVWRVSTWSDGVQGSPPPNETLGVGPSSSQSNWAPISASQRVSLPASSASARTGGLNSLSMPVNSANGQRSWSAVARTSPSFAATIPGASNTDSRSQWLSTALSRESPSSIPELSSSSLPASLEQNNAPSSALPIFESEDAELQYVLQLSLTEA